MAETIREILTRNNALDAQIKVDMSDVLWEFEPEVTPFLTISSKMASEQAMNTKVQWMNKNPLPDEVMYTGATESSASTTITIANYSYLRKGDRLYSERTGEIIRVTATPSSSSVSVSRDWGSATAGAGLLNSGERLIIMGTSQAETDTNTEGRAILPVADYNYTERWEDYARTSEEAELMQTYTGQDLRQQSVDDMQSFHRKKIEYSCVFGERAETAVGSYYCRTMRGIHKFITTNVWPMADITEFTRLALDDFLMQINESTPDKKDRVMVCSGYLKSRMGGWALNTLQLNDQKTKFFGMEINTYHGSTGGKIDVVEAPLFVGDYLSHLGIILEYDKMAWKWLKKTVLEMNVQERYRNYSLDKMSTIGSMRFSNENRMGLIKLAA